MKFFIFYLILCLRKARDKLKELATPCVRSLHQSCVGAEYLRCWSKSLCGVGENTSVLEKILRCWRKYFGVGEKNFGVGGKKVKSDTKIDLKVIYSVNTI